MGRGWQIVSFCFKSDLFFYEPRKFPLSRNKHFCWIVGSFTASLTNHRSNRLKFQWNYFSFFPPTKFFETLSFMELRIVDAKVADQSTQIVQQNVVAFEKHRQKIPRRLTNTFRLLAPNTRLALWAISRIPAAQTTSDV